jgi:hypothetical protein
VVRYLTSRVCKGPLLARAMWRGLGCSFQEGLHSGVRQRERCGRQWRPIPHLTWLLTRNMLFARLRSNRECPSFTENDLF